MDRGGDAVNLDFELNRFRDLLYQSADAAVDFYAGMDQRRMIQTDCAAQTRALFAEPLPESAGKPERVIQEVETKIFNTASMNAAPLFFGYVTSGGTQMGVAAEMLAAALNQNPAKWHLSPPAVEIEKLAVRWIAEFIGLEPGMGGVLTGGGSDANFLGLAAARRAMADWDVSSEGLAGRPPMTAYVSSEGHFCLDKALDALGIGRGHLRKIPVREDFTIDLAALADRVAADRAAGFAPFCVIGNAGTVNTGAVDPLDALADFCAAQGLWLHVDAAYGGPAASVEALAPLFRGLDRADSIAVDPHKWLYAPFAAGCALIRDVKMLRRTCCATPDYLAEPVAEPDRFELFEHSFQLSRGFRALKLWMAFKTYGAGALRRAIEDNVHTAGILADRIDRAVDMERLAPVPLSTVCFRYLGGLDPGRDAALVESLNARILKEIERDGGVFLSATKIHGKTALRACLVNHRTEPRHTATVVERVRRIGERIAAEAPCAA